MAKRPMPGSATNYQEMRKGRFSWDTSDLMEGGGPMSDKAVEGNRSLNRMAGERDTRRGSALEARGANVEGHNRMTDKAKREAATRKLEADAKKPGASRYAKDRAKYARETGMVKRAKGGSVSKRADGCATKGKTKGRFV